MTVDMTTRQTTGSRVIAASPEKIFEVLSDASLHAVIDGSGMVSGNSGRAELLELGTKFGMKMRLGLVPYRIGNEVVEFEPNRRIAWRHFGHHVWRYELEEVEGGTLVTETFDWSTSRSPKGIELMGYPAKHEGNIERTLERLDAYLTNRANSL